MPLVNHTPLTASISIGENGANGQLIVRGIGFPEVAELIHAHEASIAPLFDRVTGRGDKKEIITDLSKVPTEFMMAAPAAAIHVIALAADEMPDAIKGLPLDVQFQALVKIGELSFQSLGGAENFLQNAANAMASVSRLGAKTKNSLISASSLMASKETEAD